jgi:hypothetical protein
MTKVRTSNRRELEQRTARIQAWRDSDPGHEVWCRTCGPVMVCDLQEGSDHHDRLVYWCHKCEQDHRNMTLTKPKNPEPAANLPGDGSAGGVAQGAPAARAPSITTN